MRPMELVRFACFDDRTLGRVTFDKRSWYTIEKPWNNNIPWISRIPDGLYECRRVESPKHGSTWEIKDVEGRTDILFHVANRAHELAGCVGLGTGLFSNLAGVSNSRAAIGEFMSLRS